jgi:hypothetical protein
MQRSAALQRGAAPQPPLKPLRAAAPRAPRPAAALRGARAAAAAPHAEQQQQAGAPLPPPPYMSGALPIAVGADGPAPAPAPAPALGNPHRRGPRQPIPPAPTLLPPSPNPSQGHLFSCSPNKLFEVIEAEMRATRARMMAVKTFARPDVVVLRHPDDCAAVSRDQEAFTKKARRGAGLPLTKHLCQPADEKGRE